jgi:hypothetical protein
MDKLEQITNHELSQKCDAAGVSKKGGKQEMANRLVKAGVDPFEEKAKAKKAK